MAVRPNAARPSISRAVGRRPPTTAGAWSKGRRRDGDHRPGDGIGCPAWGRAPTRTWSTAGSSSRRSVRSRRRASSGSRSRFRRRPPARSPTDGSLCSCARPVIRWSPGPPNGPGLLHLAPVDAVTRRPQGRLDRCSIVIPAGGEHALVGGSQQGVDVGVVSRADHCSAPLKRVQYRPLVEYHMATRPRVSLHQRARGGRCSATSSPNRRREAPGWSSR